MEKKFLLEEGYIEPEYDNIFKLAKKNNFKIIVVKRRTWGKSYAVVTGVTLKPYGDGRIYGNAYGSIHYSNGNEEHGEIPNAGCYQWKVIEILNGDMTVDYIKSKTKK